METVDLNMEDIFEDHGDDFPTVGPLPDLPEEDGSVAHQDNENEDDAENSEILSKLKDLSKGAAKKVVRKPIPKLDATRLCGERGIPILPKTFQGIKFKGKGHEAKDLGVIMRYLEHWAHRLFPKMPFDEVLERIERLGTKKEVQSCIKRMRLDMPILSSDFVPEADNEDEDELTNGTNQNGGTQPGVNRDAEEVWDEMIREEEEAMNRIPTPVKTSHLRTALSQPDTPTSYSTDSSHTPSTPTTPHTPVNNVSSSLAMGLTPEQVERMERNKRQAMEKRNKGKAVFKVPATPTSTHGSPLSQTKTTPPGTVSNSLENGMSATSTDSDAMSEVILQQDREKSVKSNVAPLTGKSVEAGSVTPLTGKSVEDSNVTPLASNSVEDSNVTPLASNSVEDSNVAPLVSKSVEDSNVAPLATKSVEDSNVTQFTEKMDEDSNITPPTNSSNSDSQMSEVFPVIDKVKQGSSTYDSSQEMSEVIPLVSNLRGDNSGDCSPSKMRKIDSV
ncbi:TIMELESS-interacting protein-like [Pecten maximus]|uniref:TIMELESS-interacting protein-like n=1 Tax=Pecten maximus TaxID=6579 RepID=UPI0014585206|nr:TIMELESS-interacting protein-like [Pecten maximus]XP_033749712.1 TIMELESS-interacting protein-like [Pecten maximus]